MSEDVDFGTVTIVGVGLLGGSIGKGLIRGGGSAQRVIGVGRSKERLNEALKLGALTEYTLDLDEAAAVSDILILCTPVGQIIRDIPGALGAAAADCTVTDVGSIKNEICSVAGSDPRFVGSHPMAGSEMTGVAAARADLFREATWAITPNNATGPEHLQKVRRLAHHLGAETMMLSPARHDGLVALTSHLPHALATALMALADRRSKSEPEVQNMTAGSFADATRVAASSAALWADIFLHNRAPIEAALTSYRDEIDQFIDELREGNLEKLREHFEAGSNAKRSWTRQA